MRSDEPATQGDEIPFSVESRPQFYVTLLRRYARLLITMLLFTGLYSLMNACRPLLAALLVGALQARFGGADNADQNMVWVADRVNWFFTEFNLLERLSEPAFFMNFVYVLCGVAVVAAVLMVIATFVKDDLTARLVVRMVVCIRMALFSHLAAQSVAYFNRQRSGDLTSRLTNDINAIQLSFRFLFQAIVQQPVIVVANLVVALFASPLLFCLVMPFYLVLMLPIIRSGKRVFRHGRGRLENLGLVTEGIQQLFSGIRIVKAFGMERHEKEAFASSNDAFIRSTIKMNRAKIKGRASQEFLYNIGGVALLIGGIWLIVSGVLELTSFLAFMFATVQVYLPLKTFSRGWNQLQESAPGVDRVLEILREKPALEDVDGAKEFTSVERSIRYEGVSFAYDDGESPAQVVLHDVTFEVGAGEMIALVGPSGAGKSTIVDLLARFYDPQAGRITVDGVDTREFRHASYLSGIGIVSQDPFLFNTTIRNNIGYGRDGASDEEIAEAARVANAEGFILEQPDGYDTVLGERGVKLSGGQRQRLTIARAVLKDAPILILDEATSALDTFAEKEVQRAMENLMRERTTFVIAHRLSTIVHADKILVLGGGRIIEEGKHRDLLALRGTYYHLWQSQTPNGGTDG